MIPAAPRLATIATHSYDPGLPRFRNICDLPDEAAEAILARYRAVGRCLKADYLARRRLVEDWLQAERRRKLGATPLERPIYLFLGAFADGRDPARPASFQVPLAALPAAALTFTWGDSMDAAPPGSEARLFTLAELQDEVRRRRPPTPGEPGARGGPGRFIEVQLWDRRPLAPYRPATAIAAP